VLCLLLLSSPTPLFLLLVLVVVFVVLPAVGIPVLQNSQATNYNVVFTSSETCATFTQSQNAFLNELATLSGLPVTAFTISKTVDGSGNCYVYVTVSGSPGAFQTADTSFQNAVNTQNPDLQVYEVVAYVDNPSKLVTTTPAPTSTTPTSGPASDSVPLYINCGSAVAYSYSGINYQADFTAPPEVQGGTKYIAKVGATGNLLIDTMRYFAFMQTGDGYHFTLPNGNYKVMAIWAETDTNITVGLRTFQVMIEGVSAWGKIDVISQTSGQYFTLLNKTATTAVTDGSLDITFIKGANSPFLSGLQITTN